jgi:hypothetical protein
MPRTNYWNRRISRRGTLAAAIGGTTGLAALGLVGCGGGDDDETPTSAAGETPRPTPTADPTKAQQVQSFLWPREDTTAKAVKGGIFRPTPRPT